MNTPFFPAWRSRLAPSKKASPPLAEQPLPQLEALFAPFIPEQLLSRAGANSRERFYTLRQTFWAFLWQALHPGTACREVVRQLLSDWQAQAGRTRAQAGTAAYCRARQRLPLERLQAILQATLGPEPPRWRGHAVKLVDGTTFSLPDTAANQKKFPQSGAQKPGCGFPTLKVVALFSLASGLALNWARGSLRVHEIPLFRKLWSGLRRRDLIIGDRGFSSYTNLALLLGRGVDCLFRLHQGKKVRHPRRSRLQRKQKLGPRQWLVQWKKPYQKPEYMRPKEWAAVPSEMQVRVFEVIVCTRGMRTRKLMLVTTLLDPVRYPVEELAELYLRRWEIELSFRDLKTTLGLEVLRCQSPAMVEKEVWMHLIAFNLLRRVMLQSAASGDSDVRHLSFKGALATVRQYCPAMAAAQTSHLRVQLIERLREVIAQDVLPLRPGRREPRAVKRRPKPYQMLNQPRHVFRELAHRGKYRKGKKCKLVKP
ncbi:IS4 family transposase [Pedosphaera parvula]|uniref:Transposase IS4 family protein n=1 Tax=Pedosphaera parvula (strain Ellin514) TaxID=320771 RepID=B9XCY0_PEDPL|nr:IS4 family transposase [Pedosphaera parvula]EEF62326.1 transposase IS4 family protein [Pedosphaera parvula Ellin514]